MHITHARLQGSHKTRAQAPRSMPWWRKPSWSTLQTHRGAAWWVGVLIYPLQQSGSMEES